MVTRKQITDLMNERCKKNVNWPAFGKLLGTFKFDFVFRNIKELPERICAEGKPTAKVAYLYAVCRQKAQVSDYKKKITTELFDIKNFKLKG